MKNHVNASGCLNELYTPVRLTSRCVWGGGVWARTARPPGRRWCGPAPAAAGQRCSCAWRWTRSWPWGRPCSAAPPYAGRPASAAPAAYVRLGLKLQATARRKQATWTSKIQSTSQSGQHSKSGQEEVVLQARRWGAAHLFSRSGMVRFLLMKHIFRLMTFLSLEVEEPLCLGEPESSLPL